jgi:branched-chain amino acid aminotransferase
LVGIELHYSEADLIAAQLDVAAANGLKECYLRPTIFLGEGAPGLASAATPQIGIAAWAWPPKPFAERGIRARLSTCRRVFPEESLSQAKGSTNYLTGRMALREARQTGFDDAILLDERGFVAEATTSNLFAVFKDHIVTPTLKSALDGITRDTVIHLLKETGAAVEVRDIEPDEISSADEIFLTGTASEITPLSRIESVSLPGVDGPYAQFAQAAYVRAAKGTAYQDFKWRTPYDAEAFADRGSGHWAPDGFDGRKTH